MLPLVNRSAVLLRPKAPYIAWAQEVHDPGDMSPEEVAEALGDAEPTVYLVPPCDEEEEAAEVLAEVAEMLFEEELEAWSTDASRWPGQRDLAALQEWFEIAFITGVVDTVDEEMADEGDEDEEVLLGDEER